LLLTIFGVAAAATPDHSLHFQLPVVTAIEADWSGEILLHRWLEPSFSPENVDVTVHFDDGTNQVQQVWYASFWTNNSQQHWTLFTTLCRETWLVTVYYEDSNIYQAFHNANPGLCCRSCDGDEIWDSFMDALPHDTFAFPENYIELFLAQQQPVDALTLGEETQAFTGTRVFSFTAPETRQYAVTFVSNWGSVTFTDAEFNFLSSSRRINLTAGETYHVMVVVHPDDLPVSIVMQEDNWRPANNNSLYHNWRRWINNVLWQLERNVLGRLLSVLLFPLIFALDIALLLGDVVVGIVRWIVRGW